MLQINYKLQKLEAEGKSIKVGLVGAGQMGRGMASQMMLMKGMKPVAIADINPELAKVAYQHAGVADEEVKLVNTLSEANAWVEKGKYVITDNPELISRINLVDVTIDATGVPEVGAKLAYDSILNQKHVVMLNVETDIVIGPLLKKMADSAGVIYTGSAGDEPGAVMELYDFADAMGMEIRVMGKGKNNVVALGCTPDTVREEATRRGVSPKMLCAFKDGTKTMVEMTAMSNATGLIPDVRGAHAVCGTVKELPEIYKLKSEGGVLNQYGVVDYVNGIAPGVFVIVSSKSEEIRYQMGYHSMGPGPNYVLYRPYHLCNLETPLSAAKAVIEHMPTIVPKAGLVSETITVAKRDLKAGEYLDGIGGYTVYGTFERYDIAKQEGALPLGLVTKKTRVNKDIKLGEIVRYSDVEIDNDSIIVQLRKVQDQLFK